MRIGLSAASLTSLTNTRQLLNAVCEQPAAYVNDAGLIEALSSQGKLASYVRPQDSIVKVSLNAFKRAAEEKCKRGFVEIDELRVKAREAIEKEKAAATQINKRSVAGLRETIDALREELAGAREDCVHLTDAFYSSVRSARVALKERTIEDAMERWQKTERELFARLSLAKRYGKRNG